MHCRSQSLPWPLKTEYKQKVHSNKVRKQTFCKKNKHSTILQQEKKQKKQKRLSYNK